jgi:predicted ATP-grasp superfamily ATP-dependent carboligase
VPDVTVLIAGVSTRAAAASAAAAGFDVTALDAFGDRDQHPGVRALALPRDFGTRFTPGAVARCARGIACDAVAYLSSFENHPGAVRLLSAGRTLWGNPPAVLRRVRDPLLLADTLRRRGLAAPAVVAMRRGTALPDAGDRRRWLSKRRASGGGYGIREWHPGTRIPRGGYLQEMIDGTPGSVSFIAAGGRAIVLGVTRQIVGDSAFGASGFTYCGNILPASDDPELGADSLLARSARMLAEAVAVDFELVGANGIDFVARDNVPHAVEVNPRWSASMELVERAHGTSVFGAHAGACATGALPSVESIRDRSATGAIGKSIVFARHGVTVGDTRPWLADPTVRDVPHPGEQIPAGRPVCTVLARGDDASSCYASLVRRAADIYEELAAWARAAA